MTSLVKMHLGGDLITAVSHFEFTRAQFSPSIIPGQANKQITSISCLPFCKELITSVHARAEVLCE
jgi:hypothetical protein